MGSKALSIQVLPSSSSSPPSPELIRTATNVLRPPEDESCFAWNL
eukprot:CAMPEP_0202837548 /NCGR_PEP_ID=MMETSP1389-20130828/46209_1 /ASSEMBLY_ACC=CAM_ASM_000865 /TAXON_ID=302021 /ORGANISM="Rhodomonas sp., Strain CCMP768" /LENGTH=44 /DNA_ID= /DNA_START= /DNA_END= /DNA_ORIENTATION=